MSHRRGGIHCSCANALYPAQATDTNVTLHAFQQISDLKIFPECVRGRKRLWRVTCGRGPVAGVHWAKI